MIGAKSLVRDYVLLPLEAVAEYILLRRAKRSDRPRTIGSVVIAAPGGGSVGDRAMLDAVLESAPAPRVVVSRAADDVAPSALAADATILELPGLIYGRPFSRTTSLREFLDVAGSARNVAVVGADVMDGAYGALASVRRFRAARLAARMGAQVKILGFSWNEQPHRLARRALRQSEGVVTLLVRDPHSLARARNDGAPSAVGVADLAFLTRPAHAPAYLDEWLSVQQDRGRPVVIVNVHGGLANSRPSVLEEVATAAVALLNVGASLVLLPNDDRAAANDTEALARLRDRISDSRHVLLVERPMEPAEVVAVAQRAVLFVTGRMHLAILAACAGTPSATLGYQGKVSGLYQYFGTDSWLDLERALPGDIVEMVASAFARRTELAARISSALPEMRRLAALNLWTDS